MRLMPLCVRVCFQLVIRTLHANHLLTVSPHLHTDWVLMLIQEPDILLLDEPTNHLDLDAIEWLERYLKQQEVPMVIVSHDREFLDQLCTKVCR